MEMKAVHRLIFLLFAYTACAKPGGNVPAPPAGDSANRIPRDSVMAIIDTEATLFPGRSNQAVHRLGRLFGAVTQHVRRYQRLPVSMDEIRETSSFPASAVVDPWQTAVRYRVSGDYFELRSAGEDRQFDTDDDVFTIGLSGRDDPCVIREAQGNLLDFSAQVPRCAVPESWGVEP
jgi:hypothetical protein